MTGIEPAQEEDISNAWEYSKENVQPIKRGRNAKKLNIQMFYIILEYVSCQKKIAYI